MKFSLWLFGRRDGVEDIVEDIIPCILADVLLHQTDGSVADQQEVCCKKSAPWISQIGFYPTALNPLVEELQHSTQQRSRHLRYIG